MSDVARDGEALQGAELEARLHRTWSRAPGLWGWLTTVDHKDIGRRYIYTAMTLLILGGALAAAMRLQLATPESGLISAARYNQIFTMHGTTMMFLFAVPVMEAVAIYIIPLMVGTRNIAFPRLNAFSYWTYLFGALLLWVAFALNVGPDAGWFMYVPLSGPEFTPGKRTDIWAQMITFTEVAAIAVAVELIVTILKFRAPGMTIARMPLYVWSILVTSIMVVLSLPAVALASGMLLADRLIGTQFYNPFEHGDALLWQHLFWFFAHPEVYIIFLPAMGFVSQIVETFTQRPVFAYAALVLATVAIGLLSFGVWVHHMFATGLPRLGYDFYTAASMAVAVPSAIQIFCWIATMWLGRPRFAVPLLYVVAFIVTFVIGGLTGVMVASVPLDLQLHDSYFVVAHLHYVLIGGGVFPLLGALTYWFPKLTGRLLSEGLGKAAFWCVFLGFNAAFFPMHITGMLGMPRRVYTYPTGMGWDALNMMSSLMTGVIVIGGILFVTNVVLALRRPPDAGPNPWNAPGLEWAADSPPAPYNFEHIPVVSSHTPLWEEGPLNVMTGLRVDDREQVVTTAIEAQPDIRYPSPEPTLWPLLSAVALAALFIGSIFTPWAVVIGAVPLAVGFTVWFWPKNAPDGEPVIE
ncbi:cytochrome c oxidase subunit I [Sphingobium sp. SCG-1]|uniref:cytochrome c oxidase subunit I n=1 Tax=Sphingobium sp. SCG-1 TaxID=2072936 RepID=UPI000CD67ED2|nr:cytochrome c oxidase subunit I [Sphingobium sp. SCG-1]AUW57039.1 cytochrome c oxidase subunit I [Sphingobium sp. SCG-1]